MSVLRSDSSSARDTRNYELSDFEEQKRAYLEKVRNDAAKILSDAKKEADKLRVAAANQGHEKAKREIEKALEDAKTKGYEEGRAKAEQEVRGEYDKKIQSELTPVIESLKEISAEFTARKEEMLRSAEETLVKSAIQLAEQVIGIEAKLNPKTLEAVLRKALPHLPISSKADIRVHPEDLEDAKRVVGKYFEEIAANVDANFIEDEGVGRGGCRVSCGDSEADFSRKLVWKRVVEALEKKGLNT